MGGLVYGFLNPFVVWLGLSICCQEIRLRSLRKPRLGEAFSETESFFFFFFKFGEPTCLLEKRGGRYAGLLCRYQCHLNIVPVLKFKSYLWETSRGFNRRLNKLYINTQK